MSWKKVESKRHPRKFYFYNKETGESRWEDDTAGSKVEHSSPEKQAKQETHKERKKHRSKKSSTSKTPAQDRLKLLQKTIQKNKAPTTSDLSIRLGLNQVTNELKSNSNTESTSKASVQQLVKIVQKPANDNSTDNSIPTDDKNSSAEKSKVQPNKVPKASSVQDRLKIKKPPPETEHGDVIMNEMSDSSPLEAMEWEPISENIVLHEISNLRQSNGLNDPNSKIISFQHSSQSLTNNTSNNFYIVLDTNIFISNLKYLEILDTELFPQLKYSYLVVPYIVLQELDNLKHRDTDSRVSMMARQAIKFLNRCFNSPATSRICGQSAMQSAEHLIEIVNSDDRIVNCCLQVRTNHNWVLLLSNDVNLRNKVMFNNIQAYSKDDLENNKTNIEMEFNKFTNN